MINQDQDHHTQTVHDHPDQRGNQATHRPNPPSRKRPLTPDQLEGWLDSKELQPPK